MGKAEEYKLIGKTSFGLWLSREGDSKYLGVSTKKIEAELTKLIRLARKEEQTKMIDAKGIEMIVKDHVDQSGFNKILADTKKEVEARVCLETANKMIEALEAENLEGNGCLKLEDYAWENVKKRFSDKTKKNAKEGLE